MFLHNMKNCLSHPGEEVLERFLLQGSNEEEAEVIETHIMACDSCVARLEGLETEISATKLALQNVRLEAAVGANAPQSAGWLSWFTMPKLSVVGACALGIVIMPQLIHRAKPAQQVTLVAYRGLETPVLPKNYALHVTLNASELAFSTVDVDVVNSDGISTWHGRAPVRNNLASVDIPNMTQAGQYYFRILSPGGKLLREFSARLQ